MASRYLRQEYTIYLRGIKKLNEEKGNGETSHAISLNVSSHIIKKAVFLPVELLMKKQE